MYQEMKAEKLKALCLMMFKDKQELSCFTFKIR